MHKDSICCCGCQGTGSGSLILCTRDLEVSTPFAPEADYVRKSVSNAGNNPILAENWTV